MAVAKNALVRIESIDSLALSSMPRGQQIQKLAYFKALERNFAPGYELDDWLAAEEEVDALIRGSQEG